MVFVEQLGSHASVFFTLVPTDNGDGTLSLPSGSVWVRGQEYALSPYTSPPIAQGAFRLWIERSPSGADYFADAVLAGNALTPASPFSEGAGAVLVCWKDAPTDDIHVLRSVHA